MDFPVYTEIFGIPHVIELVERQKDVSEETNTAWGEIIYEQRRIRIFSGISDRDKLLVLFEEMLHGVLNNLDRDDLGGDHKFVTPVVNGLFTALEKAGMLKSICNYAGAQKKEM